LTLLQGEELVGGGLDLVILVEHPALLVWVRIPEFVDVTSDVPAPKLIGFDSLVVDGVCDSRSVHGFSGLVHELIVVQSLVVILGLVVESHASHVPVG